MTHSVALGAPTPDSPRGQQLKTLLALEHLLCRDLPFAEWRLGNGALSGQLIPEPGETYGSPAEQIAWLESWAEFLGAAPSARVYPHEPDKGVIEVRATYRDVRVRVWDGLDVADLPAEWLAESEAS